VGGTHLLPEHAADAPLEGHGQVLKVPQDGPQGAEVVDAKDEVEAVQVDAEATDGEVLLANAHGHIAGHAVIGNAVAIGHHDPNGGAHRHQPDAAHDPRIDEVVGRAAI
jgi:hypothetical protein